MLLIERPQKHFRAKWDKKNICNLSPYFGSLCKLPNKTYNNSNKSEVRNRNFISLPPKLLPRIFIDNVQTNIKSVNYK